MLHVILTDGIPWSYSEKCSPVFVLVAFCLYARVLVSLLKYTHVCVCVCVLMHREYVKYICAGMCDDPKRKTRILVKKNGYHRNSSSA